MLNSGPPRSLPTLVAHNCSHRVSLPCRRETTTGVVEEPENSRNQYSEERDLQGQTPTREPMPCLLGSVVRDAGRGSTNDEGGGGRRSCTRKTKKKDPVDGVEFWHTSPLASNTSTQHLHRVSPHVTGSSYPVEGNPNGGGVQEPRSLGVC